MGLMINPAPTFTLNNGDIASEGFLYFYENGSTTVKKSIYSNSNLTTELINPLPLTDAGRLPTCFGDGTYTIILKSSDDVQQWVRNDVTIGDLAGQFSDYSSVKTYSINEIVRYVDGNYYYSLQNNNKGNAPSENSEFWAQIAFLEFFNTAKAADEDYMENDIVIFGGFIYRSLEDDNGDTPPSAKWANLTFNDSVAGNFAVGGDLTVTGEAAIGSDVSVGGQLDVTGPLSSADLTVTGGLGISGSAIVDGDVRLLGNVQIGPDVGPYFIINSDGEATTNSLDYFAIKTTENDQPDILLTLLNGYTGSSELRARVESGILYVYGEVLSAGSITGSTPYNPIATLPVGYRPAEGRGYTSMQRVVADPFTPDLAYIRIATDGTISWSDAQVDKIVNFAIAVPL